MKHLYALAFILSVCVLYACGSSDEPVPESPETPIGAATPGGMFIISEGDTLELNGWTLEFPAQTHQMDIEVYTTGIQDNCLHDLSVNNLNLNIVNPVIVDKVNLMPTNLQPIAWGHASCMNGKEDIEARILSSGVYKQTVRITRTGDLTPFSETKIYVFAQEFPYLSLFSSEFTIRII